ncbi:hypothetical protein K4L44_02930 [Halosquirtibacter laminarini]|uniref:Uncharacterized protein n=1 Tax=Halosquirtibacter laminarini TaxID=3374600 RepID=A0AC61NGQ9_9BACT|nr:hypothetical protein K4L44_02930 [Prolixibacteraceae bacterium]
MIIRLKKNLSSYNLFAHSPQIKEVECLGKKPTIITEICFDQEVYKNASLTISNVAKSIKLTGWKNFKHVTYKFIPFITKSYDWTTTSYSYDDNGTMIEGVRVDFFLE